MDPIRPKTTQNVPISFPIYYVLLICYIIALEADLKAVDGAEIAYKGQKTAKMQILQSYNMARFVQYGKIRVRHDTEY